MDASGNAYLAGYSNDTWGSPLIAYDADYDGFAAKLDGSGVLTWNTFLGGSAEDHSSAIFLDGSGVYLTGYSTDGWGSPVRAYTSGNDVFAAKLTSSGKLRHGIPFSAELGQMLAMPSLQMEATFMSQGIAPTHGAARFVPLSADSMASLQN